MRSMLGLLLIFATSKSFAWGAHGHQVVSYVGSQVAAEQSMSFWAANADGMRTLSTVPDRVWKGKQTKDDEAPTHWFQADAYVQDLNQCQDILAFPKSYDAAVQKYSEQTILKNGTAPWRIVQFYNAAVRDFKAGNMQQAVEEAGVMSHYIGDLSQPLHVSENYDGVETGQKGIHAWFETTNLQDEMSIRAEVLKRAEKLIQDPQFLAETMGDLQDVIYHEVIRSVLKRDEVLDNDKRLGRDSDEARSVQLDLAEDRMADGAAVLAVVLVRMSKDAGLDQKSGAVQVDDAPAWIAPDYNGSSRALMFTPMNLENFEADDDCGAI